MKPLHARSRALIEAARPAEEPSIEDRARVRARLMASLAGAAVVGAATNAAGATASTAVATGAVGATAKSAVATGAVGAAAKSAVATGAVGAAAKSAVATGAVGAAASSALVAGTAGTGIWKAILVGALLGLVTSGAAEIALPPAAPPEATIRVAPPVVADSAPSSSPSPRAGADVPSSDDVSKPSPVTPEPTSRPAARAASTATAASVGSVREEVELLKDAQRAIVAGETTKALELLDAHASRFESGALRDERLAARAVALCGAGRDAEARSALAEFLGAAKGSLHEPRVRAACARLLAGADRK